MTMAARGNGCEDRKGKPMKLERAAFIAVTLVASGFLACSTSHGSPPDPAGVVTVNLSDKSAIDFETGTVSGDSCCGYASKFDLRFTAGSLQLTTSFQRDTQDANGMKVPSCGCKANSSVGQAAIASIDSCTSLGEITSTSGLGFTPQAAVTFEECYAVKTYEGSTYRVVMVDWLEDTSGGVIGVTIKYARL
jgi:hypothetical protein